MCVCALPGKAVAEVTCMVSGETLIPTHSLTVSQAAHTNPTYNETISLAFGDRSFATTGPCVWNSPPASIRDLSLTLTVFNNRLDSLNDGCNVCDFEHVPSNVLTN